MSSIFNILLLLAIKVLLTELLKSSPLGSTANKHIREKKKAA